MMSRIFASNSSLVSVAGGGAEAGLGWLAGGGCVATRNTGGAGCVFGGSGAGARVGAGWILGAASAEAMAWSALQRQESRGAHKRLDQFDKRDDERFLQHTLAFHQPDGPPRLEYQPVHITRLPPAERVYGGAAKKGVLETQGAKA